MKFFTFGSKRTSSNNTCCSGTVLDPTALKTRNRFKIGSLLVLMIFGLAMLTNNDVNAQITEKTGNIPVEFPEGGFAVDGDAFARTPNNLIGDWWINLNPSLQDPPRSVFNLAGEEQPHDPETEIIFFTDKYKGDTDPDITVFAQSDKINQDPATYDVKAGSVPPKDDMQHSIAVFTHGDSGLTGAPYAVAGEDSDLWCLFAADRWKVNGSSYIDFEFNQKAIILDEITGKFTSEADSLDVDNDPTGGRTPGDILVTILFTNGGGIGNVWVDTWEKDGIGMEYYWKAVDLTLPKYANTVFITPNLKPELAPWSIYDQPTPYTYEKNQYAEGAINLSDIFGADYICGAVATVWTRTKSSHSTTAQLKDLGGITQLNVGPPAITVSCADDVIMPACSTEQEISDAFTAWKGDFGYKGGTPPITESYAYTGGAVIGDNLDGLLPPDICGGAISITYTVSDFCEQTDTCTATFATTAPTAIGYTAPADADEDSCDYANQTEVQTSFDAWVTAQTTALAVTGGCDPQVSDDSGDAPALCDGGTATVTWTITDLCETIDTITADFNLTAPAALGYTAPADADEDSCDYANQTEVQTAFDAWVTAQTTALAVTGGCDPQVSDDSGDAPVLCDGGTATVTWTITDLCETIDTITADFNLTAPAALGYTAPADANEDSCDYANQTEVQNAFDAWVTAQTAALAVTGGCDPQVSDNSGDAPALCDGGTATVTWTITDLCETINTITADFNLTAPDPLVISDVQDTSVNACDFANQAAVNAAFDSWLTGFTVSGGCDPQGSYGTPVAPDLCGGYVDVTFNVTDLCENGSDTARFTVTAPDPLDISDVQDLLIPGCTYGTQGDLNAAFANWLTGFTVTGGCDPQGVFAGTYTAPDVAAGGFVDVVYNVTDLCENGSDTARFTVEPCVEEEGCTLGYWKNHTDRWDCYETCTPYNSIFTASTFPSGLTLLQALNLQGNTAGENLARQSVAALLNICSGDVSFSSEFATISALQTYVNAAFTSGDVNGAGSHLDYLNNAGDCPLGGTSATTEPSTGCVVTSAITRGNITLESSSKAEQFSAYPVPFKETLNIQYKFGYTSDVTIQIFDMRGQLMQAAKEANASKDKVTTLSTNFARGNQVYIVKVTTDRETFLKKIISKE